MRTFSPVFGLLHFDHRSPTMVDRKLVTFLSQECLEFNDTPQKNEVNPGQVASVNRLFAGESDQISGTEPEIIVSASLGVGLIPAYSTGRGAVMAVRHRAYVRGRRRADYDAADISSRVMECALALLGHERPRSVELNCKFHSRLPQGAGLKTSSAQVAAITAVAGMAMGYVIDPAITVRIATAIQAKLGLTQAGCLDDTLASVLGGLVIADASAGQLIARLSPPPVRVVILVPKVCRPWAHQNDRVALLKPHAGRVRKMHERLLEGDLWGASTDSAFFHSAILRYCARPLQVAMDAGALGVCLSGKGPAVAAFTTKCTEPDIVRAWGAEFPDAKLFCTTPSPDGITIHQPNLTAEGNQCR